MFHLRRLGAINCETKTYTHPAEACKDYTYQCVICEQPVILRHGSIRVPHFSHKQLSNCVVFENTKEDQTHLIAQILLKQILTETNSNISISQKCNICSSIIKRCELLRNLEDPSTIFLEYPFIYEGRQRRADVAYLNSSGEIKYIFEIYNTHKTDPSIRPEPWFEFDASVIIQKYEETIMYCENLVQLDCIRSIICDSCLNCLERHQNERTIIETTPNIYFNQRGAGCGKTYESVQLVNMDDRFEHKELFIYLTKVHSAKEVIYQEFNNQLINCKLNNLVELERTTLNNNKQIQIKFYHTLYRKEVKVLIGTVDSFSYAMADHTKLLNNSPDYFKDIINTINAGYLSVKNNKIYYAGTSRDINSKCLILIDESQDLHGNYIEAFDKIIERTKIDIYLIGDKLQSIYGEQNIYTHAINNLTTICLQSEGINQVQRFHHSGLMTFVNGMVQFEKYGLPQITGICNRTNCGYSHCEVRDPYEIFQTIDIWKYNKDPNKFDETISQLMSRLNQEVLEHYYLPKNFMFVFPFVTNNTLASRLEFEIRYYWASKFEDPEYRERVLNKDDYWKDKQQQECYMKTALWHKSENGQPIDLSQSEHATRILSIHASKGNGCEVVFVLGITESALKLSCDNEINLKYESLLHVAITRQKQKLYFGVVSNSDDIHNRIKSISSNITIDTAIEPTFPHISSVIKTNRMAEDILNSKIFFHTINNNIIQPLELVRYIPHNKTECSNIDYGDHIIRYSIMYYYYLQLIYTEDIHNQIETLNGHLYKYKVGMKTHCDYIEHLKKITKGTKKDDLGNYKKTTENYIIPILTYSSKETINYHYSLFLEKNITRIKKKFRESKILENKTTPNLCVIECVIYVYIINVMRYGINITTATISQVYDIMDILHNQEIDEDHTERYGCVCHEWVGSCKYFKNKQQNKYDNILCEFYSDVLKIKHTFELYKERLHQLGITNLKYNVEHSITVSDEITILNNHFTIAHNETSIIYNILEPKFNALNFNKIILYIIFSHYCLTHLPVSKNYERYKEKKIYACIFTFDSYEPIIIDIDLDEYKMTILQNIIRDYLNEKYQSYNNDIYRCYKYFEDSLGSMEEATNNMIQKIKYKKTQAPEYILDFFKQMDVDLEDDPEEKIQYYSIQKNFEKMLNKKLNRMITKLKYLK